MIERLHKEVAAVIAHPAIRTRFADLGAEPINATPEETARHIGAAIAKRAIKLDSRGRRSARRDLQAGRGATDGAALYATRALGKTARVAPGAATSSFRRRDGVT